MAASSKSKKSPVRTSAPSGAAGAIALGADNVKIKQSILRHLTYTLARDTHTAAPRDWWISTALAVREHVLARLIVTQGVHNDQNVRRLYYFSLEYLMGRLMENNLYNTGLVESTVTALRELGVDFEKVRDQEVDMGLGNGGLGRLAACFLDSLATQDYPAIGYGIHYEFGLFKQEFVNGNQIEHPDSWMIFGTPWEVMRPEYAQLVKIYGQVENVFDDRGNYRPKWVNARTILGVPYDIPIAGYATKTVNLLRLWRSRSTEEFDLQAFNSGGYMEAFTRTTKPRQARSCASYSSTSLSPARCATSFVATSAIRARATTGIISPTRLPSSSTIRTPLSPCLNSCASSSTRKTCHGITRGTS
jgi:glycogen phosphorylase